MRIRLAVMTAAVALAAALTACTQGSNSPDDRAQTTTAAEAAGSGSGSVWVADEGADSLTVFDASTDAVVATLTGIEGPHNVQVSRDGTSVYAVSGGSARVVAIDSATYAVDAVAATGSGPAHVIEAPNGKVYVTNAEDGTVSVYQGPGLTPAGAIDLGGMPHGLRSAAGGSIIVVANMADRLDLIDPTTDRLTGTVPVGKAPVQVAVTADGRFAYSSITEPPSVLKVDLVSRTVVGSVPVPTAPVQLYLTPDEKTLVSANQGTSDKPGDTISVIDAAAMTVRGTVGTGSGPHGVVIDETGTRAWVTNTFDGTVSAVDLDNLTALATIPVGKRPNGISYSPKPPTAPAAATVALDLPAVPSQHPHDNSEHGPGSGHGH